MRPAPCAALFLREALAGELLATAQRAPAAKVVPLLCNAAAA
jgi:hypothetical protein